MEKIKKKKPNVFTEILPFYLTLKFAGIFPLSFNTNNGGDLRTKTSDKLVSVIAAISMASISVAYFRRVASLEIDKINIVAWGWYIW